MYTHIASKFVKALDFGPTQDVPWWVPPSSSQSELKELWAAMPFSHCGSCCSDASYMHHLFVIKYCKEWIIIDKGMWVLFLGPLFSFHLLGCQSEVRCGVPVMTNKLENLGKKS